MTPGDRRPFPLTRRGALIVLAVAIAGIGLAAGAWLLSAEIRDADAGHRRWAGPVHEPELMATMPLIRRSQGSREHAQDASHRWADIRRLEYILSEPRPRYRLDLGDYPPAADTLDPDVTVIAYGIVLETTGDNLADYVVGLDNDARPAGSYRAWLTNLATGETDEQVGPPYGYPVEFRHPDEEWDDRFDPGTQDGVPSIELWFLEEIDGVDLRTARFYAWTSVTSNGEVVDWDYLPDAGWLRGLNEP